MKIIYWFYGLIAIIFIASLVPLIVYACTFDGGISTEPVEWSAFGSIMGAVSGSLAFVIATTGILVNKHESNKSRQNDLFFKLLDLHLKKVDAVVIDNKSGYEAFRFFAEKANKYLFIHLAFQKLKKGGYHSMSDLRKLYSLLYPFESVPAPRDCRIALRKIKIEDYQKYLNTISLSENVENYKDWIDYMKSLGVDDKRKALAEVYRQIYTEDGHLLGQYFRNMYYTMKTFDEFGILPNEKKYYGKLFRAQLGKSELALGLFNAVWDRSGKEMVDLLLEYDILDDIYSHDVILFTGLDTKQAYDLTKEILNSYLKHPTPEIVEKEKDSDEEEEPFY